LLHSFRFLSTKCKQGKAGNARYHARIATDSLRGCYLPSILSIGGRWRAQVRRRGQSLARTFDTKADAKAWAEQVEAGIVLAPSKPVAPAGGLTVEAAIDAYRRLRLDAGRAIDPASNEHYMLEHLSDDLGDEKVPALEPARLVKWAQQRKSEGAGAYTINMELSKLGTVLRHVASFQNLTLPDVIGTARPLLHHLQLIGGGHRRTRRPQGDELDRLLDHFADRPDIADALRVLAVTGLRRGELVKLTWAELDRKQRAVLVRKRKHPRQALARDEWVPLLGEAWAIVDARSKTPHKPGEHIFGLHPQTLTKAFTEAARKLGIPDLHLHDLRREAASRLRELGFDADERKRITGHRSDAMHERYINVDIGGLHAKSKRGRRKG
jgi:integrase